MRGQSSTPIRGHSSKLIDKYRIYLTEVLLALGEEELDGFPDKYGLVIVPERGDPECDPTHKFSFHDGDGNYDEIAKLQDSIEDARLLAEQHSNDHGM